MFYPYPKIGQFRDVIYEIKEIYTTAPKLLFSGSAKAHGTNAAVVIPAKRPQYTQSKTRVLTLPNGDHYGFATWCYTQRTTFQSLRRQFESYGRLDDNDTLVLYGEWAGKGIQRDVGIAEADRFFYLFDAKKITPEKEETWLSIANLHTGTTIVNASQVMAAYANIFFDDPQQCINRLIQITESVEAHCPIARYKQIDGIGEGVVWKHTTPEGRRFMFKVKGEKHSPTKTKKPASVDPELVETIGEFIEKTVTENRLQQGMREICNDAPHIKQLGAFIKWVSADIHREEEDVLQASGLSMRDVGRALSNKARTWFFEQLPYGV